jgi:hypothetical protein
MPGIRTPRTAVQDGGPAGTWSVRDVLVPVVRVVLLFAGYVTANPSAALAVGRVAPRTRAAGSG